MRPTATGFLYGYPASKDQDAGYRLWLVTCKHVVQIEGYGLIEAMVRMNKSEGGMQRFKIREDDGPQWTFHPEGDVAVIPTSWPDLEDKGVAWEIFAKDRNALRRNQVAALGFTEGDEVFVLGFPTGWRAGEKDYPIVRHGMLAQIQGWLNQDHNTFLVDGAGFPGNSGGPVVTKPPCKANQPQSWLIGMVSARPPGFAPASVYAIDRSKNKMILIDNLVAEEAVDLIKVIPMDTIDETIEIAMQNY